MISDLQILVKTCILLYKYKINSRQILRLLLEKYTKEVIEYFNNDCSVDETIILTEMIKKLFILSIKHRKEFPVHLLSHCKKGQTFSKSGNRSETDLFESPRAPSRVRVKESILFFRQGCGTTPGVQQRVIVRKL